MKNSIDAIIHKGASSLFSFAWLKNAMKLSAAFTGGLFFLMSIVAIVWMGLEMIPGYNDPLNQKVVDSGQEIRSTQEFQAAQKYHGNDAWFCEWDSVAGSWIFYRNGKCCKTFTYLDKK